MEEATKQIFMAVSIPCSTKNDMVGVIIPRDILLDMKIYNNLKLEIEKLKGIYSSSAFTCLHNDAQNSQKWPLLNLVRQLLLMHGFSMTPLRSSNGYSKEGKKLFKRSFRLDLTQ